MTKNAVAKTFAAFAWSDTTRRSTPESTGPITLSLSSAGVGAVDIAVSATIPSGRTAVQYEIERSLDGVAWTPLTLTAQAASEIPARNTATPTKWVHPSGTLDGHSAYTSLTLADAAAVPGDVIVVSGTYNTRQFISTSGSPTNRIYWRAFDYENPPIIDGNGTAPPGWGGAEGYAAGVTALVGIQASYVTFDGFIVRESYQHGIQIGACNNNGAFFYTTDPWYIGIEVYRCQVSEVSQGLIMWKTEDPKVGGCDFSRCQNGTYWSTGAGNPVGWGSAVSMAGRNVWFVENTVRQTMGEGVHIGHHIDVTEGAGNYATGTKGFTIRRNTFYDCWSDPIYATIGSDGVIEENLVFMSDDVRFWYARNSGTGYPQYGIGVGGELGAFGNPTVAYDMDYNGLRDVKIRNNIINGANRLFSFKRFEDAHKTKNIEVDHNTIFCTKGAFPSIYEALQNIQTSANEMTGIKFRNNAVLVSDASDISITWNSLGSGKVVQGNLFSHSPPSDISSGATINAGSGVIADKTYSATSTGWPNAVTFDLSKATPYLSGATVSPLVNAVASIGTTVDYYGNARPTDTGFVDIGAISLSKPASITYRDSTAVSGQPNLYRGRFRDSSGELTGWSPIRSISV